MYHSDMMSTQLTDSTASYRWPRTAKSVAAGLLAASLLAAVPGVLKADAHLAPSSELHQSRHRSAADARRQPQGSGGVVRHSASAQGAESVEPRFA